MLWFIDLSTGKKVVLMESSLVNLIILVKLRRGDFYWYHCFSLAETLYLNSVMQSWLTKNVLLSSSFYFECFYDWLKLLKAVSFEGED